MVDIVNIGLSVDSRQVDKGAKSLNKFGKEGKKTQTATDKMTKSFKGMGSAIAAMGLGALLASMVKTAASFETMAISLEVVTGSAEKATQAMAGITEFAKNTPFQVSEITDAFIKLKALGIEPTEAKLRSFGDTSSAMGKSLNQMIEAVADAATGEFERLKEFGIKASSQGDQVSFTFQGITKTVQKNSKEITQYLEDIGKTQFAGAMSKQMNTLNGKLSNLGDSFDQFALKLFQDNKGGKGILDVAIIAVDFLKDGITLLRIGLVETLGGIDKFFISFSAMAAKFKAHISAIWTSGAETRANIKNIEDTAKAQINAIDQTVIAYIAGEQMKAGATDGIDEAGKSTATGLTLLEENDLKMDAMFDLATREQAENERTSSLRDKWRAAELRKDEQLGRAKINAAKGIASNLSTLMASGSKKMFEIGKKAAIASALINTYEAVTLTMAKTPYPWNIPLAIAQGVAGIAQVSSIQSQSFGGGGGVSISGGTGGGVSTGASFNGGAPSNSPTLTNGSETQRSQVSITLNGAGYSKDNVRELIASINEELGDGMEILAT